MLISQLKITSINNNLSSIDEELYELFKQKYNILELSMFKKDNHYADFTPDYCYLYSPMFFLNTLKEPNIDVIKIAQSLNNLAKYSMFGSN